MRIHKKQKTQHKIAMSKSIDDDILSLCANCGKGEESAGDLKSMYGVQGG